MYGNNDMIGVTYVQTGSLDDSYLNTLCISHLTFRGPFFFFFNHSPYVKTVSDDSLSGPIPALFTAITRN